MAWKGLHPPIGSAKITARGKRRHPQGQAAEHASRVRAEKMGLPHVPDPSSIYIMEESATRTVKIGRTRNLGLRLSNLQSAHSSKLRCYGALTSTHNEIVRLERAIHTALKGDPRRRQGEWYIITPEAAVEIIQTFAVKLGISLAESVQFPIGDLTGRKSPSMVNELSREVRPRGWASQGPSVMAARAYILV